MKTQDKQNLIHSWPVYLLFLISFVALIAFYPPRREQSKNEPLQNSITKSFYGLDSDQQFKTIEDIINDRKSWQPILPDWQTKPTNDFSFMTTDTQSHTLTSFLNKQTIVLIWATWYPACKMQLIHLQNSASLSETPVSIIALTAENLQTILDFPTEKYPDITFASVTSLPPPFSLPASIPAIFFLDSNRNLKLAAEGLVPVSHIIPILDLPVQ